MGYEHRIEVLGDGSVLAECGPMRLRISARVGRLLQPQEAMRAAKESIRILEEVAAHKSLLSSPWPGISEVGLRGVALEMLTSVAMVGDQDLTPMAAVAGTIADWVADHLAERGMTRVIVDNGGDIAIRLQEGETVRVGLRAGLADPEIRHVLVLEGCVSGWGVATSGLGGRSFTRGIALAATVLAKSASLADAAATAVANATWVPCAEVRQVRAGDLDPDSDIAQLPVTVEVGDLSREVASRGLAQGLNRASALLDKGVIIGAFLAVGGLSGSVGLGQRLQAA